MIEKILQFARKHWVLIALILVAVSIFMTQSAPARKIALFATTTDRETSGCSTCSAGDAGVVSSSHLYYPDFEEENNMPDNYYDDTLETADSIGEISKNPDEIAANVEDREADLDARSPDINTMIEDYYGTYSRNDDTAYPELQALEIDDDGSYGEYTLL